ncbi:50S ribosomal protein L10 [Marinigracilibium pacificum]|uniref:Large ribosomal subunit protein uL10 n=1 Tax=Marinigracilibium pacificum TaxID=2729599 RepID=A0A848J4Q8_9BACT|nr:50S ribosomal protein L10 [Marinigracilibium pacificum]NMM49444.1 50S ribosomal protein L10 [Marinigracilibium pacificum]
MTREEKAQVIESLVEKFNNNPFFYIADASGLTVGQINDFRRLCFKEGVEYKVVKNTLIKKALEQMEADFTELDVALKGFSGIIFSPESNNAPAKVIKDFRSKLGKGAKKPLLKGASIDSDIFVGDEHLETLSNLKSKNELIGEVITLLQSPAKNVISALKSGGDTIGGIVKTLQDREA